MEILLDPSIALKHFHRNIFFSWNIFYWLAAAREKETFHWLELVGATLISGWGITLLTRSDMGARHGACCPLDLLYLHLYIRRRDPVQLWALPDLHYNENRTIRALSSPPLSSPLVRSGWRLQLWTWWGHWGNQYRHHTPHRELKTQIIEDKNSSHIYKSDFKILPGWQPHRIIELQLNWYREWFII